MASSKDSSSLVAAPRHLRKRFLRAEIPDTLLVPGVAPFALENVHGHGASPAATPVSARVRAFGRKRLIALMAVTIVSISIPALVLALVLAG